jgi:hypothetical protein
MRLPSTFLKVREQTTFLSRDQIVETVWLVFADQISRLQTEPVEAVVDGMSIKEDE